MYKIQKKYKQKKAYTSDKNKKRYQARHKTNKRDKKQIVEKR